MEKNNKESIMGSNEFEIDWNELSKLFSRVLTIGNETVKYYDIYGNVIIRKENVDTPKNKEMINKFTAFTKYLDNGYGVSIDNSSSGIDYDSDIWAE